MERLDGAAAAGSALEAESLPGVAEAAAMAADGWVMLEGEVIKRRRWKASAGDATLCLLELCDDVGPAAAAAPPPLRALAHPGTFAGGHERR
eukprot:3367335-Prymnesium_polylepis.1